MMIDYLLEVGIIMAGIFLIVSALLLRREWRRQEHDFEQLERRIE